MGIGIIHIVLLAACASAAIAEQESAIWNHYRRHKDIDVLCDRYSKMGKQCVEPIEPSDEKRLQQLISADDTYGTMVFINQRILQRTDSGAMNLLTCERFWEDIEDAEASEIVPIIEQYLTEHGFTFRARKFYSKSNIERKIRSLKQHKNCLIDITGALFGDVKRNWLSFINIPIPGKPDINIGSITPSKEAVVETITKLFSWRSSEYDKVDQEIQREIQKRQDLQREFTDRIAKIDKYEKECYLNHKVDECIKMNRAMDEYILDFLGTTALRIVRNQDTVREAMYMLARVKASFNQAFITDQFELIGTSIRLISRYWILVVALMAIVMLVYRPELKMLTSIAFLFNGLSIIPIAAAARYIGKAILDRCGGVLIACVILLTTAGVQFQFLSHFSILAICYGSLVVYLNIFRNPSSYLVPIGSFIPLVGYVMFNDADFTTVLLKTTITAVKYAPTPSNINNWSNLITYEQPGILSCIAIALPVTIYSLCNYCDVLGGSYYTDIVNANSRSKPTTTVNTVVPLATIVSKYLCLNTFITILCVALPGFFTPTAWMIAAFVALFSLLASALIYVLGFHDDYIREGNTTASCKDRVIETMNIIEGMAPREIIKPKFDMTVMCLLVTMAFVTGLRHSVQVGFVLGLLAAIAIYKRPHSPRTHIDWFTGIAFLLCGSFTYAVVGILYLFFRIGKLLKIDTSTMGTGQAFLNIIDQFIN